MVDSKIIVLYRRKIDKIDNQIILLLKKRFKAVKVIMDYRKKNKMKLRDKEREKEILRKRIKSSKLSPKFVKRLFKLIINESRRLQK